MVGSPNKIGKYDVIDSLGQGAMGIVYKGFDPLIQRYVALKTIQPGFLGPQDEESSIRFQREAQAAGNLSHPNIVAIFEYGEDAGRAFIAMEYVEGRTLGDLFKENHRFALKDIHSILTSVLSALAYSHNMGVIHRDIKPGNIMLDKTGTVKVMDFGVARIQSSDMTLTGTILGTPGYMSPEQLMGEPVDPRSDLYSTGIVLYELLTGERAFTGATFSSVIYKVFNNDLSPPSRLKPTMPGALDSVIEKACAKKPDKRFQSANAFATALNDALAQGVVSEKTIDETPTIIAGKPEPSLKKPAKLKPFKMGIAIAVILVIGIVLAVFLVRPTDDKPIVLPVTTKTDTFKDCDSCPEMEVVPPGQFFQGASSEANGFPFEQPRRLVNIDYSLAVSRYEITRAQFAEFASDTGFKATGCSVYDGTWKTVGNRSWESPGFDQDDSHPVTCVSWKDADAYVRWLSEKTGRSYRLLSASEWEFIVRKGDDSTKEENPKEPQPCDTANVADQSAEATYPGWNVFQCRDDHVHTAPVGSFKANALGIHDLTGNVFEWVADCWNEDYINAPRDGSPWLTGDCSQRVLRGGSWFTSPGYVRPSFRNRFASGYRSSSIGFRVSRLP